MQCRYAESGFYIAAHQVASPCCSIDTGEYVFPYESIDQFLDQKILLDLREASKKGHILNHPACADCVYNERRSLTSTRHKGLKTISKSNPGEHKLKRLDIAFGNTCNLDCVMCSPEFSSKYNAAMKDMPNELKSGMGRTTLKNHTLSYEKIDEILDKVGNTLESVILKGGEPLYDKKAQYFLNKLVDINPNVKLEIISNCTIINQEFLSKFKNITITASIDGIYEIYEYIRGFDFKILDNNIEKLIRMENVTVRIIVTVSKYNFAIVPQTIDYWKNKGGIEKVNLQMAREPWNTPFLVGEETFRKISKKRPPTKRWKWEMPRANAHELHEIHKTFWNSRRGMDWDSIDVSRY